VETLERLKLDAMKELAYGASHEINNPLANISARAQTLLRDEQHPERRRALEAIHQQAMRAHEMISDLMLFARPPKLDVQPFDLRDLLAAVQEYLAKECLRRNVQFEVEPFDEAFDYRGDFAQLRVALSAVCTNSLEAIGQDGSIGVQLSHERDESGKQVAVISVVDDGPGISAEVREHLFDPFYSGREAGRGLGFGLSKCWRIVSEHGGSVAVCDSSERGTTISLQLPIDELAGGTAAE
jgi:signal transduction histidine kinase